MKKLEILFKPYISILFLRDIKAGIILFLLSFLLPSVGILGVVAIISTILFAEIIKIREEYIKYGFYLYNSLLVGMGVGFYYSVTFSTVLLTVILAILTFLISFGLNRVFIKYSLPILSLPFAIVSMFFYLASFKYTKLLSNILNRHPFFEINFPFLREFFVSMGTIFFLPYVIAGIVISLIIIFYSRILFFLALIGFYVGVYFHSFFTNYYDAINSPYNFNFILISMAVGGIFLLPMLKNYIIALIAVMLSVIVVDAMEVFFNFYSLPVYTMPFNFITLLVVLLLYSVGYNYFNYSIKSTPEKSLISFLSNTFRFGGKDIKIHLPFFGKWCVYQAFNGEWTHKGKWKYAYDFVIKKNGRSYKNDGVFLEDYYAFGENVLSPINGYVVAKRDDLKDNPIGVVDRINNWGNYVIIRSDLGFFVEISHLMQYSVKVNVGDYVRVGDIIGKCGNSGYSPEPHIHIQVQKYGVLGSETVAFKFYDYIKENRLYFYSLPKKGDEIEATVLDKSMQLRLNFILDDEYVYKNEKGEIVKFSVKMNEKGEFYFFDGKNRLYFYQEDKLFYFYEYEGSESYLKEIFKIVPKIPLINKNVIYEDILPIDVRLDKIKLLLVEFLLPFNLKKFLKKDEYKKENLTVKSDYGEVYFSFYEKGFEKIIGNWFELRRFYEKNN
jgi:urea transporter/murein DD-endopeptidase MepM/ murein hydrolase activator NlpD